MVSPQTLLAIGIGLPLLMIAVYTVWLGRRVARLEDQASGPDETEGPGEAQAGTGGASDSGNF